MTVPPRTSAQHAVMLPRTTLERFRDGEARAFAEVVRAHDGLVRRVVARYWSGAFEREEAMQEIWAHVYRQRTSLDLGRAEELRGWLATLARRRCLDLLRRPGAPVLAGESEAELLESLESPPEPDRAEARELAAAVEAFAAKLKPAWRAFFDLYFVQGLDYAEAAAALGISRLRCKYMKKVLLGRAQRHPELCAALGRARGGGEHAP